MNAPEILPIANIHERLWNWARACREGIKFSSCGSMEKRYSSPQCWHPVEPTIKVDQLDAEQVEMAWRTLQLKHKMMLKWCYVYPVHPRVAERKAKVRPGSYEQARKLAEFKIAVALAR